MTLGEKTGAQCIADNDAHPFKDADTAAPEVIATLSEDFTSLEASCLFADIYRERMDADIGLIAHACAYRGNLLPLFAGDVTANLLKSVKPRSLANKSALVKVSMTGAQLLEAINHIKDYELEGNALYAFSGLKCTVAPWKPMGQKYLSVTLADGAALDPAKLYTVALWEGTIDEAYITAVLETCEGGWEAVMAEAFKAKGTVAPARDGRITLVWDR